MCERICYGEKNRHTYTPTTESMFACFIVLVCAENFLNNVKAEKEKKNDVRNCRVVVWLENCLVIVPKVYTKTILNLSIFSKHEKSILICLVRID